MSRPQSCMTCPDWKVRGSRQGSVGLWLKTRGWLSSRSAVACTAVDDLRILEFGNLSVHAVSWFFLCIECGEHVGARGQCPSLMFTEIPPAISLADPTIEVSLGFRHESKQRRNIFTVYALGSMSNMGMLSQYWADSLACKPRALGGQGQPKVRKIHGPHHASCPLWVSHCVKPGFFQGRTHGPHNLDFNYPTAWTLAWVRDWGMEKKKTRCSEEWRINPV